MNPCYNIVKSNIIEIFNKTHINHSDFLWICNLMKLQENWQDKIYKITNAKLVKIRDAIYLKLKIINCNKWITFSWRKSCKQQFKQPSPLISAMRQSINIQINSWKKQNNYNKICNFCGSLVNLQADHNILSFKDLVNGFLENKTNIPNEFDYAKYGYKFKKSDNLFKYSWNKYHKKNLNLQWLCKKCNIQKK